MKAIAPSVASKTTARSLDFDRTWQSMKITSCFSLCGLFGAPHAKQLCRTNVRAVNSQVRQCSFHSIPSSVCDSKMPKKLMKSMKKTAKPWQDPKRGKRRVRRKPATNKYVKFPYARHRVEAKMQEVANQRWGTSVQTTMSLRRLRRITMLKKTGMLPEWKGKECPRCGVGKMGDLKYNKISKVWAHRCNSMKCHKYLQPHDYHAVFFMGAGNSQIPLHVQASILLCATAGVKETATHLIFDIAKKPVENIYKNLEVARSTYVLAKEKNITYGGWQDVEVDVGKFVDTSIQDVKNTSWEQWGSMVERGNPASFRMFRLNPSKTKKALPAPDPSKNKIGPPLPASTL